MLEQIVRRLLRDPCDLAGMVDVSMEADLLAHFSAFVRETYQGIRPRVALCDSTWSYSKTFGSKSYALDVRHIK
jgi:hypothetical protein